MALLTNNPQDTLTIKKLMEMLRQSSPVTSDDFIRRKLQLNASLEEDQMLFENEMKIELSEDAQQLMTFVQRALRIFHSSTGSRNLSTQNGQRYISNEITEQFVFPDENDVYFYICVRDYAITKLVFCVQDVYFHIPVNQLPTGMGIITQFKSAPSKERGVDNVKGEIADFIEDYLDEYGTTDEFVPEI